MIIGVDVGNYDVKTAHTSIPSGYTSYKTLPYGGEKGCLKYDDTYYMPDNTRFKYVEDKTEDEKCFILTLMAVSDEIIHRVSADEKYAGHIADGIAQVKEVELAVGLPPAHLNAYKDVLKRYYTEWFGRETTYEYGGYNFSFILKDVGVFPQDYSAVKYLEYISNEPILDGFQDYYAIDIGGYTVDIVPVIDGKPNGNKCVSDEMGILRLYDNIVAEVRRSIGRSIDYNIIVSYLNRKPTMLSEDAKNLINRMMSNWADEIINKARQSGILFDAYPVIFIGGGSLLLKKYFCNNKLLLKYEFCEDANANAKGFEWLMEIIKSNK